MALTQRQLDDLVRKLGIYAGTECTDETVLTPALDVYFSGTADTATIQVTADGITLATTVPEFSSTLLFSDYPSMGDMRVAIEGAGDYLTELRARDMRAASRLRQMGPVGINGKAATATLNVATQRAQLVLEDTHDRLEERLGIKLAEERITELSNVIHGTIVLDASYVRDVSIDDGHADGLTITYTGNAIRATVQVGLGRLLLQETDGAGTTRGEFSFGPYGTTLTLAAAVDALPDWSALGGDEVRLSDDLARTPLLPATVGPVNLLAWTPSGVAYDVLPAEGMIHYPSNPPQMVRVRYTAGWRQLPQDVEIVLLDVAKSTFQSAQRDRSLTSERLGDYAYTAGGPIAAESNALDAGAKALYSRYQRVLV